MHHTHGVRHVARQGCGQQMQIKLCTCTPAGGAEAVYTQQVAAGTFPKALGASVGLPNDTVVMSSCLITGSWPP